MYERRAIGECFQAFPPWAVDSAPYVDTVGVQVLRQGLAVLEDALALHAVPMYVTAMLVEGFGCAAYLPAFQTDPVKVLVMLAEILLRGKGL